VQSAVDDAGIKNGSITVFAQGSTGAVSTAEYEPGLLEDMREAFERIAPRDRVYHHNKKWGCDNGRSHVRAAVVGPGVTVPVLGGRLALGTWQQIVFFELDTRPRERKIVLTLMGEVK
jgi:secondary thiamine-phosphate synthase enzyme